MAAKWLKDTVFYEIYPQSFNDTNGDGIGDIPGITEKLDYIKSLGCNALWINPCYDSPFKDAGYDVRDYKKVAPRYGTNEDLYHLFDEAHKKGIRVLLDLVPGHTSEEHPWFRESQKVEKNEYSDRAAAAISLTSSSASPLSTTVSSTLRNPGRRACATLPRSRHARRSKTLCASGCPTAATVSA